MALNAGHSYVAQVGAAAAGRTVLAWLVATYTHSDEATWRERIARGEVEVGSVRATPERVLRIGEIVTWHRPPWDEPEVPTDWRAVHVDESLLVVTKPASLPTMPAGGFLANTLLSLVKARFPEARLMHRLGRGTSGLVLFARTPDAAATLQRDFREHRIRRTYRTLASGRIETERLEITTPIGAIPHPVLGTLFAADPDGKRSRSIVHPVAHTERGTLCDVDIETGRPHQIRIHLASIGHPLVGDPLYAPGGRPHPDLTALPGDGGYLLHARRLAFAHPTTGAEFVIEEPPPESLRP